MSFDSLGLEPFLCRALDSMSIRKPTEVQAACIPPILQGRDCIGSAQTGSGKTIAFATPILQALAEDPYGIFALVLTPTRELAFQIADQFVALGTPINLQSTVVVGGLDMMAQATALRSRPHVVIATPGRLVDLMRSNQNEFSFARLRFLVLDEADRMLNPTFADELGYILAALPKERQTLLFTATVTDAITELQQKTPESGKKEPFVHLAQAELATPENLRQLYVFIPTTVRDTYLYALLKNMSALTGQHARPRKRVRVEPKKQPHRKHGKKPQPVQESDEEGEPLPQTILFASRCRLAAQLSVMLTELGIPNTALHSHLTQRDRLASLSRFRASAVPLLVATDVGSRGLDIPEVDVVLNYDVPRNPDDYIHRVGRTARAGRGGVSVSFVTEGDVDCVDGVEQRTGIRMAKLEMNEESVLEDLNKVSTAKRVALLQLSADKFGERQEINKRKNEIRAAAAGKSMKLRKEGQLRKDA
ncbi:uncharacterized protein L969DRAFT_83780 [Mixia osmundae IAM 14324]|uniref:ATP-dependent RNA helicase DBP8 n=1 Tax=Mixia osmundae (strain CBS 9802 / IAM 14324 / JCM 22182 / KY 12970) TaxID=764103 RepID=G7E3R9_MIXOS|nr:uncharacterized protein L969DRAFT_83780 [Mixia osmundae IAM 14324]KEI41924.1 hypothetical protein L969DRAFT_83780 [Mixia osmundae IAM 14324]GAA97479.1 hypothetical protein E5Q_04157 [Mixia osmundae IAM 14324]